MAYKAKWADIIIIRKSLKMIVRALLFRKLEL